MCCNDDSLVVHCHCGVLIHAGDRHDHGVRTVRIICRSIIMSWKRRVPESKQFFQLMKRAGFTCTHEGQCVYTFCSGATSAFSRAGATLI